MKWRRYTPGAITLLFVAILLFTTGRWDGTLPKMWGLYPIAALVISAVYQITGLRNLVNKKNHEHVNETVRSRLVEIADLPDDPERFSWLKVRPLFYRLIDNDKSLSVKSETIKSNGAYWTGFADLTALAGIFALVSLVMWKRLSWQGADLAFGIFIAMMLLGVLGSLATTIKHRKIVDEQIDVIEFSFSPEVRQGLNNIV